MFICIIENMNQNYNRIPCFVEKNQNNKYNMWYIKNKKINFQLQVPTTLLTLPQNCV